MEFFITILFIWIIILQCQVHEIKITLKDLKNTSKKLLQKEFVEQIPQEIITEDFNENEVVITQQEEQIVQPNEFSIEEKEKNSFEKIFLGNIFNKIGAIAILIGFILFVKIVSPFIVFTPQLKLALGYIAGFAMMFGAFKMQCKENLKNYAEVLMGTGLGTLFITTYCGATILDVFSIKHAITLATILLFFSFGLAQKYQKISTLAIAIIAGYLNIIFVHSNTTITPNFIFGYLIFINILSLIYVYKNQNCSVINIINLITTFIFALCLFNGNNIYAHLILFGIYHIYDYLTNEENISLNYLNYTIFFLLSLTVFDNKYLELGFVQIGTMIIYFASTYIKHKKNISFKSMLHLGIISLNFAIYLLTKDNTILRPYIYSIETIILTYLAVKNNYKALANWGLSTWAMAVVSIIPMESIFYIKNYATYNPIWNIRLATFTPLIFSAFVSTKILNKSTNENIKNLANICRLEAISMTYLFTILEINSTISKYYMNSIIMLNFARHMINIILGFIYTIQIKKVHQITKNIIFEIASAIVGIFTIIYLLCTGWDYSPLESFIPVANIRVLAFLSAILAFVLYSNWTKQSVFKYIAIFTGFWLVHLETVSTIKAFDLTNFEFLISVNWILYSAIITILGVLNIKIISNYFFEDRKPIIYSGIVLCLLTVLRIFFFDLANTDIVYKFIAFLTLGLILMLLSYIYNKKQGNKNE